MGHQDQRRAGLETRTMQGTFQLTVFGVRVFLCDSRGAHYGLAALPRHPNCRTDTTSIEEAENENENMSLTCDDEASVTMASHLEAELCLQCNGGQKGCEKMKR